MPIYKRGSNKYTVRVYTAGRPQERIIRGTRAEAEKFEARWRLELAAAGPVEYRVAPSFLTFSSNHYKPYAKERLAPATFQNRRYTLATLINFFGELALDKFTTSAIAEYQTHRLASVGAVKVNDEVRHLRTILAYAVSLGIPANVPKVRKLPEPKTKGRVAAWTADEVTKLYNAIRVECPRLLGMAITLINTGMRKGEVLALEWSWVDLNRGLLFIQPNRFWRPKSNKAREVPISTALVPWLDVEADKREHERFVFVTRRKRRDGRWSHSPYVTWPQNQFDRAIKMAGIGGSPHVARHTYASHFLAAVPDLFLLAQILGHGHTRVTEIYSHMLPDHLARARNAVNMPAPPIAVPKHDPDTVSPRKQRK